MVNILKTLYTIIIDGIQKYYQNINSNENNDNNGIGINNWTRKHDANSIRIWRESIAQLRQLHGDVWNGVRFFLTMNGIIIAAMIGLTQIEKPKVITGVLLLGLAILGVIITIIARSILSDHRNYYLKMLLKKTLLEYKLGFYDQNISHVDLSFPWNVEKSNLDELLSDPQSWIISQRRRKGSITEKLFIAYEIVILLYLLAIPVIGYGFYSGYFYN